MLGGTNGASLPPQLKQQMQQNQHMNTQIVNKIMKLQQFTSTQQAQPSNILAQVQQYNDYICALVQQNGQLMHNIITQQVNQNIVPQQQNIQSGHVNQEYKVDITPKQFQENTKSSNLKLQKFITKQLPAKIAINMKSIKNLWKLVFGLILNRSDNFMSGAMYFLTSDMYLKGNNFTGGFNKPLSFQLARELMQLIISIDDEYYKYLLYKAMEQCIYKQQSWLKDNFYIKDSEWVMEFVDRLKIQLNGGNIESIDDLLSLTFIGCNDISDKLVTMNQPLPIIMKSIFNQINFKKCMSALYNEKGAFIFVQEVDSRKQFNIKSQNNFLQPDCVYDFYIQSNEKNCIIDNRVRHICLINRHFTRETSYFTKLKLNYTRHLKSLTMTQCTWSNFGACPHMESLILISVNNVNIQQIIEMKQLKHVFLSGVQFNTESKTSDLQVLLRQLELLEEVTFDDACLPKQFILSFPMRQLRMLRLLNDRTENTLSQQNISGSIFKIHLQQGYFNKLEALFVSNRRLEIDVDKRNLLPELCFVQCVNQHDMAKKFMHKAFRMQQTSSKQRQSKINGEKSQQSLVKSIEQPQPIQDNEQNQQPIENNVLNLKQHTYAAVVEQKQILNHRNVKQNHNTQHNSVQAISSAPPTTGKTSTEGDPLIAWPSRPGDRGGKILPASGLSKSMNASKVFGVQEEVGTEHLIKSQLTEQNIQKVEQVIDQSKK